MEDKNNMPQGKINLIYSMLLNIQEGVNEVVNSFNTDQPDWEEILDVLNEKEAELVYVLSNAKNELDKKERK